jgi:hypothetical protein
MKNAPNPVDPGIAIRNLSRALLWLVPLWAAISFLVAVLTERGVLATLGIAMAVTLVGLVPWTVGVCVGQFKARGRLLLDCGPYPLKWLHIWLAVTFVAIAGREWSRAAPDDALSLLKAIGFMVSAAGSVAFSLGRLQVGENGIWAYWELVRWEQIRAYRWTVDATLWIEIEARRDLFGPRRSEVRVPPEFRERIEASLVRNGVPRGAEVGGAADALGRG